MNITILNKFIILNLNILLLNGGCYNNKLVSKDLCPL